MIVTRARRLASLGAAVALAASACAGQGGATSAPTSPTTAPSAESSVTPSAQAFDWKRYSGTEITFLADVAPWTDGMNTLVDQFTQQTGIKVKVESYSEDLYMDKQEQVVRAPTGTADVYFESMDSIGFSQFNANAIEPLDGYLNDPSKTASDYNLADYPKNFLVPGTFPAGDPAAKLYGIPITFETYILFYNKDLVQKYLGGKLPTTMDELTAAAAQVSKDGAKDGVVGSVVRGIRSGLVVPEMEGLVANRWGSADTPQPYNIWYDGAWDKPRLTDPAICAGMTDWAKLLAQGPSNKYSIDWPDAVTLFSQGKVAFYIDASLFSPTFEDASTSQVAGKVGYAQLPPASAGGKSYTTYWEWGLGIPMNALHKDAAWYFVQWMTNATNTAKIGAFTGGAARLSAYSDPAYTSKLVPEYVTTVQGAMQTARTTVVMKDGWDANAALTIDDGMLAIANGGDPTASCAAANAKLLEATK
jgi:multiple sugar transport system substrate-binding protein